MHAAVMHVPSSRRRAWHCMHAAVMHACAQFMAESMQSFLMHKQAMALAVLPTTMVHPSLLLGVRGRLRSMPLHSHAIVAMSRSTAESMHAAVMHVPRSRRRACMPLSCMCHVRVREHACCCHACAQFEAESMHAGVMHVPRSRRENMHADVMHVPRSSRRACNCCCHTCATFESESMHAGVMHVPRSRRRACNACAQFMAESMHALSCINRRWLSLYSQRQWYTLVYY